jgi:Ala-tRNA(Pro) deacylase
MASQFTVDPAVSNNVLAFLKSCGCDLTVTEHEPTLTSEDSARVRGESLRSGAKALFVKVTHEKGAKAGQVDFVVVVIPADRKLDSKGLRKYFGGASIKFASEEELNQKTGLVKGSLPPLGCCVGGYMTLVDQDVLSPPEDIPWVCFNAGSLERSVKMAASEYADKVVRKHSDSFIIGVFSCS